MDRLRGVEVDASTQRVIMRFPTSSVEPPETGKPHAAPYTTDGVAGPSSGGMYALTYPATSLWGNGTGSVMVEPSAAVQLYVHTGGWKVAARQYGRWLRSVMGPFLHLCFWLLLLLLVALPCVPFPSRC
jgi:hypothetical protein